MSEYQWRLVLPVIDGFVTHKDHRISVKILVDWVMEKDGFLDTEAPTEVIDLLEDVDEWTSQDLPVQPWDERFDDDWWIDYWASVDNTEVELILTQIEA